MLLQALARRVGRGGALTHEKAVYLGRAALQVDFAELIPATVWWVRMMQLDARISAFSTASKTCIAAEMWIIGPHGTADERGQ